MARLLLGTGAEASVFLEEGGDGMRVVKERLPKTYRHPLLDLELRRSRTRREASLLAKLPVPGPTLLATDRESSITMGFIDGVQLKHLLDEEPSWARVVGERVARLHDENIIHGDLTTSNMLLRAGTLHFIDFGLSFTSSSTEDKAVDLHLFKQALESKHHRVFDEAYREFVRGYSLSPGARPVLNRLKVVEARGRNKAKF